MTDDEMQQARAALHEILNELAAIMPPFSPAEEKRIQLSMKRDGLLRELNRAREARDREAMVAAGNAIIALDEEYWRTVNDGDEEEQADAE